MLYNGTLYLSVYVVLAQAVRFYNYVVNQMRDIRDGKKISCVKCKVRPSNEEDMWERLPSYCRYYNYYLALTPEEMQELIVESL